MSKPGSSVLVTGGGGFIGSHLCDRLLDEGYEVTCLDNFITGNRANLEGALGRSGFTLVEGDVEEPMEYDVDFIFHLASPASPVDYSNMPIRTMMANSVGTLRCLELACKKEARMLMSSTSEVYGDPHVSPQREDYFGNVNPVGPRSCYDEGKRFSEALCKSYEREHGVDVVIVRIFNTYGSRMRRDDGRVIPNFICQSLDGEPITIYGDGGQTRSFCFVRDMVRGIMLAMFTGEAGGEVMNIGNPNEMRVIDLAGRIRDKVKSQSQMVFSSLPVDDPLQRKPDIDLAMRLLGWAPEVDIEEGLEETIEWFRKNR